MGFAGASALPAVQKTCRKHEWTTREGPLSSLLADLNWQLRQTLDASVQAFRVPWAPLRPVFTDAKSRCGVLRNTHSVPLTSPAATEGSGIGNLVSLHGPHHFSPPKRVKEKGDEERKKCRNEIQSNGLDGGIQYNYWKGKALQPVFFFSF